MSTNPLEGLLDATSLAARLGVDRNTINVWRTRARQGKPSPLADIVPVGELTGAIWTEAQAALVEAAMADRRPGRPGKKKA